MSRLVETFLPQLARRQHQAAAEAFLTAVTSELASGRSNELLKGAQLIPASHKDAVISSLRQSLSQQLSGQARLTGADVARSLTALQDKVLIDGLLAKLQTANSKADSINQIFQQIAPSLEEQDSLTQLDAPVASELRYLQEQVGELKSLYKDIQNQQEDFQSRLADLTFGQTGENLAAQRDKQRALSSGMAALKDSCQQIFDIKNGLHLGIAYKIDRALDKHDAARTSSGDRVVAMPEVKPEIHEPVMSPMPEPRKGILKTRPNEQILIDPQPKWVDDGIEAEVPKPASFKREFDQTEADRANAMYDSLPSVDRDEDSFAVRFVGQDSKAEYPSERLMTQHHDDENLARFEQMAQDLRDAGEIPPPTAEAGHAQTLEDLPGAAPKSPSGSYTTDDLASVKRSPEDILQELASQRDAGKTP